MPDLDFARRHALTGAVGIVPLQFAGKQDRQPDDLTSLSLESASAYIRKRAVSPVDLTRACLGRVEVVNPAINAFITVAGKQALTEAEELHRELRNGKWRGPLHGIPIALKDNIDTAGVKTTCASAQFADRIPTSNAVVLDRVKSAGATILGKLNLHECAHGTTSAISHCGPVRNPWNRNYIAGGSSGGSAAAVAARLCYGAVGTDTGASIRLPAACCGIVGLKPTCGLVSARGVVPDSWSLDHVGPMCRTATDPAIMLSAMAAYDPEDPGSTDASSTDYYKSSRQATSHLRVGRLFAREPADKEIAAVFKEAVRLLRTVVADVRDYDFPSTLDLFGPVADAEAYAFHAPFLAQSPELYDPDTRKELLVGSKIAIAEYMQGIRDLNRMRRRTGALFRHVDSLVLPIATRPLLRVDECHTAFQFDGGHTGEFNIYGIPTTAVPCGFTSAGLPVAMQIAGPRLGEARVLALARKYQRLTDWHTRTPAQS